MKWTRGAMILVAAVAAASVIVLGAWQGWIAEAQGDTYIVNDVAPAEPECGTPDFTTTDINSVIALVDAEDTLVLCEGTYDGGIVVGKKLTIEGQAGVDVDKIVVEVAAPGTDGITLQAEEAVVRHLFLEGPGDDNGVLVAAGTDKTTVSGIEARDWDVGINVVDAENTLVEGSNLHDNGTGMNVGLGGSNEVRGNKITANTTTGLSVYMEDQTVAERNLISGNDGTQVLVSDLGFMTSAPVHIRLARNDIDAKAGADGILIIGTHGDSFVQISGSPDRVNNFSGPFDPAAGDYYVELGCGAENTVDATNNWWGSSDRIDIANRIFNDADDPDRGFTECNAAADQQRGGVVFDPWATAAWTPTPSPTPSATPSPTPTPTPPPTRTFDLEAGWNDFVWTGADGTSAELALACITGDIGIAYMWGGTATGWLRYVPDRADVTNLETVNMYDSLLVLVTADTQCVDMPVAP